MVKSWDGELGWDSGVALLHSSRSGMACSLGSARNVKRNCTPPILVHATPAVPAVGLKRLCAAGFFRRGQCLAEFGG